MALQNPIALTAKAYMTTPWCNGSIFLTHLTASTLPRQLFQVVVQSRPPGIQWIPKMQTSSGPTSSVLIIKVSFVKGLELFIITMTI